MIEARSETVPCGMEDRRVLARTRTPAEVTARAGCHDADAAL